MVLERNPGRSSRDEHEGASATGQKRSVTISHQREVKSV